jgi:hypothetical protein
VRFSLLLSIVVVLVVGAVGAGCYNPGIKNKGFSCSADVADACPAGFFCVDGLCQDKPGTSSGIGGVGGADAGSSDMSMTMPVHPGDDLAMPPDMSLPPPDMVRPTCRPATTSCLVNEDCCSMSCSTLFGCN